MSKKPGRVVIFATLAALVSALVLGAVGAVAAVDGTAVITAPAANARVSGSVEVKGTATATNFQFYKLEFASGASPTQWSVIGSLHHSQVTNGTLGTWEAAALPTGPYTLKLTVVDNTGNWIESSLLVTVGAAGRPAGPPPAGSGACAQPARPIAGLTLVPLAVRSAFAPSGSAPDRGAIQGRVLDASGRGICGLAVRITRTGFQQTTTTGDDGSYELSNLQPGTYSAVVEQQISTPAEGLNLPAGQALQVDFVQIRPPSPTVTPTGTVGPSPTPTASATPTPSPPTPTASPTPTPRVPGPGPLDVSRWWGWLGFDIDLGGLASHLYLGMMGGFLVFTVGVVVWLVRR